jgi:AcrR family transcriptional regulator
MPSRSQLVQDRALRSREALVLAATHLWEERSVEDVKVAEICAEAGISKGLFYFYFDSREALAADLVCDDADRVAEAVEVELASRHTLDDVLRTAITTLGRRARRRPPPVLSVAVPEWVRAGLASDDRDGLHVPLASTFARIVESGIAARRVRAGVEPDVAGLLLADATMLAVHEWAISDKRQPSLARRLGTRVDLVRQGFGR